MKYRDDAWNDYFKSRSKKIAAGTAEKTPVSFGDQVYLSPIVFTKEKGEKIFYRWEVMEFKGEFNVFVERIKKDGGTQKTYAATFTWKESAIKFALEMLLICTGKMTRDGGIFH